MEFVYRQFRFEWKITFIMRTCTSTHSHQSSHTRVSRRTKNRPIYILFFRVKNERLYSTFDNRFFFFPFPLSTPYITRSLEHKHQLTRIDNLMVNLSRHGHNTTATPRRASRLIFLRWPVTSQGHVRESLGRSPVRAAYAGGELRRRPREGGSSPQPLPSWSTFHS